LLICILGVPMFVGWMASLRSLSTYAADTIPASDSPERLKLRRAERGHPSLTFSQAIRLNPRSNSAHVAGRNPHRLKIEPHVLKNMVPRPHASARGSDFLPMAGPLVPLSVAQVDVNEDGVPDLIQGAASASGGVLRIFQATYDDLQGLSSFTETGTVTTRMAPELMAAGDFDGDAHQDLILTSREQKQFLFLAGDGHGLFRSQPVLIPGPVRALLVADLPRRDGHDDLIVGVGGRKLLIYDRWDFGFTAVPQTITVPAEVVGISLTDFNRDYVKDLMLTLTDQVVVLYGSNTKRYTLGTGVGARRWTTLPLGGQAVEGATDDFTGDRRPDLVVHQATGPLLLYANDGLNTEAVGEPDDPLPSRFSAEPTAIDTLAAEPAEIMAANLDGDRAHDLAVLDRAGRQVVMIRGNQLTGEFEPPVAFPIQGEPVAMLTARLNADARDDLLILDNDGGMSFLMSMAAGDPVVTKTADTNDGVCDADCSLREAIAAANAGAGPQTITFNIPLTDPGFANGVFTISLASQLPGLTNINGTTVNGQSQLAFTGGTNGSNPVIVIDGNGAQFGLILGTDSNTVRKVQLIDFTGSIGSAGAVDIPGGNNNQVISSYGGILVTTAGTTADATVDNTVGILLNNGASMNTIGSINAANRNVISNNFLRGIEITDAGTSDNTVEGNYIGTDVFGSGFLNPGNGTGVLIFDSANNTIGGTVPGARNVISGNRNFGVQTFGSTASGNQVQGNYIGISADGSFSVPNGMTGVEIEGGSGNTVGGAAAGARNVISDNGGIGVVVSASMTWVLGNYIGTDVNGTAARGNARDGVLITFPNNTIGGTIPGARNIISANGESGVILFSHAATGNQVQGNFIGTDVTGTIDLGNVTNGVQISGASGNTIGGTVSGARNVISGNNFSGVAILSGSTGNQVQGNLIGTDVTGTADLGNTFEGVFIGSGASNNTIGGTAAGAGNVISGNNQDGVEINGDTSTGNVVQGNLIGTDVTGMANLGNSDDGVDTSSAPGNTIGGTAAGAGNVISGNNVAGVRIPLSSSTGNRVQGNSISSNTGLGIDLGGSGVTGNDANDPDAGPNNLQNSPGLTSVVSSGSSATIQGAIDSAPGNSTYPITIEFFSNSACDPSGFGEGQTFLGSTSVSGPGNFTVMLSVAVAPGSVVTATATDANGNTSEFSPCITVVSSCTITCPSNITTTNDSGQCGATVTYTSPTTTGSCGTVTCTPSSGSFFPVGTTTVTCTTTAGPSCSFTVTVNDAQPPTITCPANLTTPENPPGSGGAVVTYSAPTVSDNCPGVGAPSCTPSSGSTFPVGTTTVTCTVSDAAGNTAQCTFTVTVQAPAACTITCPANVTVVTTNTNQCGAVVTYPAPTTTGSCGTVTCTPASGSFFPVGTTTVTCTTTTGPSCSFTVTVKKVFVLADDLNGNCVVIQMDDCATGAGSYCWRKPDGTQISGPCVVSIMGGTTVNAQSTTADPNLFQGGIDLTRLTGQARLRAPRGSGTTLIIRDSNTTNSTCNCP
jgi:CSLREA domain-containing protein